MDPVRNRGRIVKNMIYNKTLKFIGNNLKGKAHFASVSYF